jgi:ubiquinone/menaquinone biosynthesis C-methylase UbiE
MPERVIPHETFAPDEAALRFHYELEVGLADQLRRADREERRRLFPLVYDELHEKVPYLLYLNDDATIAFGPGHRNYREFTFLRRFLTPETTYLEIGPGGCELVRAISPHVGQVYAVDVSETAMLSSGPLPENVTAIVSDGTSVPAPEGSVDLAWSANLIEHLHPDDAREQLENVYRTLKPGGQYICMTPSRITGPHDVSVFFGHQEAVGFHLKEYSYRDIVPLFRSVGLTDLRGYVDLKGRVIFALPAAVLTAFERVIESMPKPVRRRLVGFLPVRALLMVRIAGRRPG